MVKLKITDKGKVTSICPTPRATFDLHSPKVFIVKDYLCPSRKFLYLFKHACVCVCFCVCVCVCVCVCAGHKGKHIYIPWYNISPFNNISWIYSH